jgi:glycerol-3-phosphate acyltransferase PlsY
MLQIALFVGAYFIGAIPFGFLIARLKGVDILKMGSGNIGATNVIRVLGKKLGLTVFALDVLKGFIPTFCAYLFCGRSDLVAFCVGMGAVAGHCLSPFLRFKGGKGVATGLGVLFGACPLVAVSAFGVFVLILGFSRFVSLSSIVASVALIPLGVAFHVHAALLWAFAALALFVIYRHRANLKRLREGAEPKFLEKSARPGATAKQGASLLSGVIVAVVGFGMLLGALSTLVR